VTHLDEGWHLHQPAAAARWFPRKWDVAVIYGKPSSVVPAFRALTEGPTMALLIPDSRDDLRVTRRGILVGAALSLICAPVIVRAASLMPVRRLPFPFGPQSAGFVERLYFHALEGGLQSALRTGRTSIEVGGNTVSVDRARRGVAYAQAHGFLPPYTCIYRA
jgi:hypothetical protein